MSCHEEVTRGGALDACGKPAVGERIDSNDPHWYPVCEKHFRGTKPWRYPVDDSPHMPQYTSKEK